MRHLLIAPVALVLLMGCGDDEATEPAAPEPEAEQPAEVPQGAVDTMEEQGESAGQVNVESDMDLLPSENGAELLIEQGHVDEDEFCRADERALQAEAVAEAEAAFVEGWERSASEQIRDMGSTMYYALGTRCLDL